MTGAMGSVAVAAATWRAALAEASLVVLVVVLLGRVVAVEVAPAVLVAAMMSEVVGMSEAVVEEAVVEEEVGTISAFRRVAKLVGAASGGRPHTPSVVQAGRPSPSVHMTSVRGHTRRMMRRAGRARLPDRSRA